MAAATGGGGGGLGGGGLRRLELPLRALRMMKANEEHPLLPPGEALGFDHLECHAPPATDALLTLLLAALHASAASPHLPPAVGWALAATADEWAPSAVDEAELPPLPHGVPAALHIWVAQGEPLANVFSGATPFDFASLYWRRRRRAGAPRRASPPIASAPPPRATAADGAVGDVAVVVVAAARGRRPAAPRPLAAQGWREPPTKPSSALGGPCGGGALPPLPTEPAEVFGDFLLFAIVHTLSLLQAALELQHNESLLDAIHLVPASEVLSDGVRLSDMEELVYEWGGETYAFRTPSHVPIITSLHLASARLDGILVDQPAPTLLPPLSPLLDLQTFWKRARSMVRCGELVRRRLHALLMQGAPYDARHGDPWQQYRCGGAGGGRAAAAAAAAAASAAAAAAARGPCSACSSTNGCPSRSTAATPRVRC